MNPANLSRLLAIAAACEAATAFSPAAVAPPSVARVGPSPFSSSSSLGFWMLGGRHGHGGAVPSRTKPKRAVPPARVGRCHHLRSAAVDLTTDDGHPFLARRARFAFELRTLARVLLPSLLSGVVAFLALPAMCVRVAVFVTRVTEPAKIGMLQEAVSSFVGTMGLLYSILMGQVFGFLYGQQEALYYALFDEVTEAKSLLEQVALVSQGRTMYSTCLSSIARYVQDDLLGGTLSRVNPSINGDGGDAPSASSITPSLILSARPADDPLEAILYLTSVGIPGQVYDTVRSLRQARARRLGALQRKVPAIHLVMLSILGAIMMMSFPVLVGVGGAAAAKGLPYQEAFPWSGYKVVSLQGGLFGVATFAVVMTSNVLAELWKTKGGAYNVDAVLRVMVRGLQKELEERMVEARKIMKRSKNRKGGE